MTVNLHLGDCLDVLKGMDDNSFDGVLCDPPYALRFMSKKWDYDLPSVDVWAEVLRVCKPGASLLAFGGDRTHHRLMVAIEDAGWDIRTCLYWIFGSGFPKSHQFHKSMNGDGAAWQGYGTALKPAAEIIVLAMKPTDGTFANNAAKWQIAGLNVDGCRIGTVTEQDRRNVANSTHGPVAGKYEGWGMKRDFEPVEYHPSGRWPANLILDEDAAALLDQQSGERPSCGHYTKSLGKPKTPNNGIMYGETSPYMGSTRETLNKYAGDTGGASRFFYTAKASRREREAGLNETEPRKVNDGRQTPIDNAYQRGETLRRNTHPTLKPLSLCEYLARLILPPAAYRETARLLVPFAGSGSEMIGALQAGWQNVEGIELEAEYVDIARRRLDWWQRQLRGNPRPLPDWVEADDLEPAP